LTKACIIDNYLIMYTFDFNKDFIFGASTHSIASEGAYEKYGHDIDLFSFNLKNKFKKQKFNSVDFYYRFKEDLKLLKDLGVKKYYFSISFSRIFNRNPLEFNKEGLNHYIEILKILKEYQIVPVVSLFYWDLPIFLDNNLKGFYHKGMKSLLKNYTQNIVYELKKYVKEWITISNINEYILNNYFFKNKKDLFLLLTNILDCHYTMYNTIKKIDHTFKVGLSNSYYPLYKKEKVNDNSIELIDQLLNMMVIQPIITGEYPLAFNTLIKDKILAQESLNIYKNSFDFIAISLKDKLFLTKNIKNIFDFKFKYLINEKVNNIAFDSHHIYDMLIRFKYEFLNKDIFILEDQIRYKESIIDPFNDELYIDELKFRFAYIQKASKEKCNIKGYFVNFFDNIDFYLNERKDNLIIIDENKRRILKESYYWYRNNINIDHSQEDNDLIKMIENF